MMRKFSWVLLVLLAFGGCGEDEKEVGAEVLKGRRSLS
jgi:hypothetical protein